MQIKFSWTLALLAFCLVQTVMAQQPGQLDSLLDDQGKVWSLTADAFLTPDQAPFFRWLTADKKDEARYPGYSNSPKLTFLGREVVEANTRFTDDKLSRFVISFYNRGDRGGLPETEFTAMLGDIGKRLSAWTGNQGTEVRKNRVAGMNMFRRAWVKAPFAVVMTWSASDPGRRDFRAEYIQVELSPFDAKNDPRKIASAPTGGKPVLPKAEPTMNKLVKKDNGEVFLDGVPMVDQGQKGYCAAAVTERILRFYGMEVSQHVIAQLADSDVARGTSSELMLKMLKRAGTKFGVKVREHYTAIQNFRDLEDMVNKYNRVAKKEKAAKIVLPTSGVIDLNTIYADFASEPFRKYRNDAEKIAGRRFLSDVKDHIDKGIPLVWSVFLGLVPEEQLLPQTSGSHMRIIIGYNQTPEEIIYSDSWGAGHEFKTMPYDAAWTITTGLYSFDPRRQ